MLDRVLSESELLAQFDRLGRTRRLIGPVRRIVPDAVPPVRYTYAQVASAAQLALDFSYCVYGPKSVLLPPRETLFSFSTGRRGFEARESFDERPTALVGVHPCDIHAIRALDAVFEMDHPDEHYLRRRRQTFIIGIDCGAPCTSGVYCGDLETNRADSGFDAMLYRLGPCGDDPAQQRFGVVLATSAARTWLSDGTGDPPGRAPTPADEQALGEYEEAKRSAFKSVLHATRDELPGVVERSYDSLLWEATAKRCYSCGSCNLSCPTCYCFNIADQAELDSKHGERYREWDGCQLRDFALVAGGHNFRSRAAARLRHRIFRKAVWQRRRTGLPGCVGCARCDRACTAKIHTLDIYNQLVEEA